MLRPFKLNNFLKNHSFFWMTFTCWMIFSSISADQFSITPLSVTNQFPSSSVSRILQDKDGFLWFGTLDGLCRYDGYRVIVLRTNYKNTNLLSNNEIKSLAEDKQNNIWIGTQSGLNVLNRETFQISKVNRPEFNGISIRSLLGANDGSIWIGAENIIYRYTPKDQIYKQISGKEIPFTGVNSLYQDSNGDIWILLWERGLYRINPSGKITKFPPIGQRNNPFRIFKDSNNQYWVCTWGDGVYKFQPNNNAASMYDRVPILKGNHQEEITFFSVTQDNFSKYIWLMSLSGIYALDAEQGKTPQQVDVSSLFASSNNIFSEFYKDKNQNIWVATFSEGAFSFNQNRSSVINYSLQGIKQQLNVTPNITSIFKEENGLFWVNQNRTGLCLYDVKTHSVKSYFQLPELKNLDGLSNTSIIKELNHKEIWAVSAESPYIYLINADTKSLIRTIDFSKENTGHITALFKDKKDNIWIATNQKIFVQPYQSQHLHLFSDKIKNTTDLTEDNNGNLWLSSNDNGVYEIETNISSDFSKYKISNYNQSKQEVMRNNIISICSDLEGNIWMGSKEGNVILYNIKTKKFEDLTTACNLSGEAILKLLCDKQNNLWISANKKIVVYNKQLGASRDYTYQDGVIVNSFLNGSDFYDCSSNLIYFGGNHGISCFSAPDFIEKNNQNFKVFISDVKVQGNSLLDFSSNSKFKTVSQQLHLGAEDKNIEIDFSSLNFNASEKIIYAYMMKGVDDGWNYTTRQFATYNQLPKGKHVFLVKATDENRLWTSAITTFEIYKEPAFYETWWAYSFYILLIATVLYFLQRFMKKRIRLQNELKIAQIDKQKSEELTQTKLKYFTNISHDLLTPLTIISCLIDDTENLLMKRIPQFDIVRTNIERLRRLLQQVLDFRKMESGNMKLNVKNGNLTAFVNDICQNHFQVMMNHKRINFTFQSEPPVIEGFFDADKIDKIVFNLLSNAYKYTPSGKEVRVALFEHQVNDIQWATISVSDTGIGIEATELDKIFTRFYNNKSIESAQTNGIGLSLTKDLVELHHGKIEVESQPEKGTTFIVSFPLRISSYNRNDVQSESYLAAEKEELTIGLGDDWENETESEQSEDKKAKARILLVEDNEDILYTLKNILQREYSILTATNGVLALEILKSNDMDIVISDVMMPEMDGLELCRKIKQDLDTSHIPVLLITAKNSAEDRIECYNAGADGYISKPFDIKVVMARIQNFLLSREKKQTEFKNNVEINISNFEYKSQDEEFLNNTIQIIEEHLDDTAFDTNAFAEELSMSKSSLYRKIKTLTGLAPNEYIRNIRLKHACQMLKDKSRSISDVAYSVGFTDPRYFATCFKTLFKTTPTEYQKELD